MADESIGNLVIEITGDYSELQGQLDAAASSAEASANTIAEAFDKPVGTEMESSLASLGSAASDAGGGFAALGSDVETAGTAASTAEAPIEAVGESAHHAAEGAGEASESFLVLTEHVIELMGALGVAVGLVDFAKDALAAYAASEQFTIGLTALTGSAEEAEGALDTVKQMAGNTAVSLTTLLSGAQNLTSALGSFDKVPEVMRAAADAAAATGHSFDTIEASLGRIAITGAVSNRQLIALGLSWGDLATSMGTSINVAQELLKKGGQDALTDLDAILQAVNDKEKGAADAFAQSVQGQFITLKNQIEIAMDEAGKALAPFAAEFLDVLRNGVLPLAEGIGSDLKPVVTGLTEAFTETVGSLKQVYDGLSIVIAQGLLIDSATAKVLGLSDAWGKVKDVLPTVAEFTKTVIETMIGASGLSEAAKGLEALAHAGEAFYVTGTRVGEVLQTVRATVNDAVPGLEAITKAQQDASDKADMLGKVYAALAQDLREGTTLQNGHVVSTADVTRAYNEWTKALEGTNEYLKGMPDSLASITGAQQKLSDEFNRAMDAVNSLVKAQAAGKDVDDLLTVAQNNLNTAWAAAHPYLDQLNKDLEKNANLANLSGVDKIIAEQGRANQVWQQAIDTYNQLLQMFQRGEATTADVARGAEALSAAFRAANPQLQATGAAIGSISSGIQTVTIGTDGFATSLGGLAGKAGPAVDALHATAINASDLNTVLVNAGGSIRQVVIPALDDANQKAGEFFQTVDKGSPIIVDAGGKLRQVSVDANGVAQAVDGAITVIRGLPEVANQGFKAAGDAAHYFSGATQAATTDVDGLVDHLKNGTTVVEGFGNGMTETTQDIDRFIKILPNGTTEILSLVDALDQVAGAAQAATDKLLRMEDAESITGSSFGKGGDVTGSSSAASMFENLASVAFGTQNFGIGGTPSDNDLVSAAAAAGLIWLGGRNFVTLDEYNAMLGASGYHASGVNPNGSAIFDQTPKNSSGGSGPASSSSSSSTNASAQVSASGTADINSSLSQLGTSSTTAASGTTALTTATTAAASTITQASQQIAQASTAVALAGSTAAVVAQAIVQAVSPGVLGSNARIDMPGAPAVPVSPIALGSNAPVGPTNYSTSGVGSGLQLTVNVSGNTVNGTQGMQDLSNRVADSIVTKLRAVAGLKL